MPRGLIFRPAATVAGLKVCLIICTFNFLKYICASPNQTMSQTSTSELKLDRTRLKTAKSYAAMKGVSLRTVYNWLEQPGKLQVEEIDGVKFIRI